MVVIKAMSKWVKVEILSKVISFVKPFGPISGIISLFWQLCDKLWRKPKLKIQLEMLPKEYVVNIPYTGSSDTHCTGKIKKALIPIVNNGRGPAIDCKAKARFRRLLGENLSSSKNEWSPWYTLHWNENSDYSPEESYKSITLGLKGDVSYVDLLLCYISKMIGFIDNKLIVTHEKLLLLYGKPVLLGQLAKTSCPKPQEEKISYPILYDSVSNQASNDNYEIELKIICQNASVDARFYIKIENNKENQIEIYMIKDRRKTKILTC